MVFKDDPCRKKLVDLVFQDNFAIPMNLLLGPLTFKEGIKLLGWTGGYTNQQLLTMNI